jgi:hypothetical protein
MRPSSLSTNEFGVSWLLPELLAQLIDPDSLGFSLGISSMLQILQAFPFLKSRNHLNDTSCCTNFSSSS